MNRFLIAVIAFLLPCEALPAAALPVVARYDLALRISPREGRFSCDAGMTVRNSAGIGEQSLPFILYRLLSVRDVRWNGSPVGFDQRVVQFADDSSMQVNAVTVMLPASLAPGDSGVCTMRYDGMLLGYPEVMEYVKDHIGEEYSLIRPDAFAYPVLAMPSFASVYSSSDSRFTFSCDITLPAGWTAACGGELVSTQERDSSRVFRFRSKIPTWRIDIAAAPFKTLESPRDRLFVYYLPDDGQGAETVLRAARNAVGFYTRKFGKPPGFNGYTIIEIPEGWGSQAGDFYFLQTAAAFRDSQRVGEVYHEIGHTWNAKPDPSIQRCRYFDEAFASFFEALALGEFGGRAAMDSQMVKYRETFNRWAARDPEVAATPIDRYGEKEMGRHSYTKGAWSLYVLHEIVGDEAFARLMKGMLEEYRGRTMSFGDFQKTAEQISGMKLGKFFDEWIRGAESSRLLAGNTPVEEIVRRYRGPDDHPRQ